jgi:BR serine/threonine kinase
MTELSHSVLSPMSFRVEYKRSGTGPTMFQRHVRIQVSDFETVATFSFNDIFLEFQVDINAICKQGDVADMLFAITFTLLSGECSHNSL